jgi:hypothetical protein
MICLVFLTIWVRSRVFDVAPSLFFCTSFQFFFLHHSLSFVLFWPLYCMTFFDLRGTDNTMAKRKRTNNDLQNIHITRKIKNNTHMDLMSLLIAMKWSKKKQRWSNIKNPGANSYGQKNQADHTPLVIPIVLLLNHTNMIWCENHVGIFMGRRVKQKKTLKIPKG